MAAASFDAAAKQREISQRALERVKKCRPINTARAHATGVRKYQVFCSATSTFDPAVLDELQVMEFAEHLADSADSYKTCYGTMNGLDHWGADLVSEGKLQPDTFVPTQIPAVKNLLEAKSRGDQEARRPTAGKRDGGGR